MILIMDSNGRFVKPELLKKSISAFKRYCLTLSATKNKIEGIETKGTIPKQLLLHVGTNDLKKMTTSTEFADTYRDIFQSLSSKEFKNCKVMISSSLVTADAFQNRVIFPSNVLSHSCQEYKMELIKHNNTNFELLYNDTHLHKYKGFPIYFSETLE